MVEPLYKSKLAALLTALILMVGSILIAEPRDVVEFQQIVVGDALFVAGLGVVYLSFVSGDRSFNSPAIPNETEGDNQS